VVVLALIGVTAALRTIRSEAVPAAGASAAPHLPEVVNAPGTWSDDEDPVGPLAALGIAMRTKPQGLTGERQQLHLFGVSAVDGRSAWLDLPGADLEDQGLLGWFALSPDGRWIGWARQEPPRRPGGLVGPLVGWSVMDTTTGEVRELADAAHPRLRGTANDLAFSGDSRYLLTSYETPRAPRNRGHQFVAWDIHDGTRTVLEEPGHYWLPNIGSAPSGVTWARRGTVHRADPASGRRASHSLPQSVIAASWAPDDTAFAYIGRPLDRKRGPWRLYAGRTLAEARDRALPLPSEAGQVLGWRDSRHVVVAHYRTTVHVVDVVTGDVERVDLTGQGEILNAPLLAADLWRSPLATPAEPEGTTDPRAPYRWAGGVLMAVLAGAWVLRRRRTQA
jgi:MYXO-CTERM domain-containing protein